MRGTRHPLQADVLALSLGKANALSFLIHDVNNKQFTPLSGFVALRNVSGGSLLGSLSEGCWVWTCAGPGCCLPKGVTTA